MLEDDDEEEEEENDVGDMVETIVWEGFNREADRGGFVLSLPLQMLLLLLILLLLLLPFNDCSLRDAFKYSTRALLRALAFMNSAWDLDEDAML